MASAELSLMQSTRLLASAEPSLARACSTMHSRRSPGSSVLKSSAVYTTVVRLP
jgi:hypothetical protein